MKINFATPLSFNSLNIYREQGINFPEDFTCNTKDKNQTPYNISIYNNKHMGYYETRFINMDNSQLEAAQEMMIWPEIDYMFIDNMLTYNECRGKGLGTCMHLTNIIEMMENNIEKIELRAVPSAIPFHIKCGFKPDMNLERENDLKNIRAIAYNKNPELVQYSQDAQNLLKTRLNPEAKSKIANKILYNYTKKAVKIMSKKEQQYLFTHNINMVLTKDDVIKHKNFYNKLFDKFGIDYQISDSAC